MTHTVHPYAHRLGIIRDWRSRWFGVGEKYKKALKADLMLREYLEKRLRGMYVAGIDIERGQKSMRVMIKTSRPGLVIGRSGEGSQKLRNDVIKMMNKWGVANPNEDVKLDILEVRNPETNASIVGQMIAEGLEKRMPFRRIAKQTAEKVMANREVKGVKIEMNGRLGGADMARCEKLKKGQIPLQTFRADIDFAREKAHMTYGDIGIKVWIYRGEVFKKDGTPGAHAAHGAQQDMNQAPRHTMAPRSPRA